MLTLNENHTNVIPLIWQGDTANESPEYSQRRSLVGNSSEGIPQIAFQGTELEIGAYPNAYEAQFLPIYNQIITTEAPMTIDAFFNGSNGEYTVNANVSLEDNFDNSDVKVVFILTRHITDEYFCSVVAYDYSTDFDLSSAGDSGNYSHSFSIDSSWDPETITAYVMVQRWLSNDSEIYQATQAGTPAVSITEANFGDAYIGSEFTKSFIVENVGDSTTDVTITIDAPGFELSGDMSYSLEPQEIQEHVITFLPTAEQTYSGYINISTDITGFENNTITLTGTGFADEAPVAENLSMEGILMKNYSIDVSYDFVDPDNDNEGNSIQNWYVSDDGENWSEFYNPNSDILTLHFTIEHVGKFFKFVVTPIDEHQMPGQEVSIETPSAIIDLAPPTNLTFTTENGNDIVLTWEPPVFPEVRGLFGYKVLRGSSFIATITDNETFTYTDENVEDGTYIYSVRAIYSPGGLSSDSNTLQIIINNGVSNENNTQELIVSESSYPNPFTTTSSIDIQTKRSQHVQVGVYNLKGQLINTLADKTFTQGIHNIVWDGRDQNGNRCSNGVYFYKIITPEKTTTKKTILMK